MRTPKTFLAIACLFALWPAATAQAVDCYQHSNLPFFQQVVQLVSAERNLGLGCWVLRLRLRGQGTRQGHAMICGGNACDPQLDLREGIYWWEASPVNQNIKRVTAAANGSCTDMIFCVVPNNPNETMLIDFIALFEEGYFLSPGWRPRWSDGSIDLSSLDETKSHCQDGEPQGAICL